MSVVFCIQALQVHGQVASTLPARGRSTGSPPRHGDGLLETLRVQHARIEMGPDDE